MTHPILYESRSGGTMWGERLSFLSLYKKNHSLYYNKREMGHSPPHMVPPLSLIYRIGWVIKYIRVVPCEEGPSTTTLLLTWYQQHTPPPHYYQPIREMCTQWGSNPQSNSGPMVCKSIALDHSAISALFFFTPIIQEKIHITNSIKTEALLVQWSEYIVANDVVRVRFPVGA